MDSGNPQPAGALAPSNGQSANNSDNVGQRDAAAELKLFLNHRDYARETVTVEMLDDFIKKMEPFALVMAIVEYMEQSESIQDGQMESLWEGQKAAIDGLIEEIAATSDKAHALSLFERLNKLHKLSFDMKHGHNEERERHFKLLRSLITRLLATAVEKAQ